MKGRALIDFIWRQRDADLNTPLPGDVCKLLVDALEIADEAARALIESECLPALDGWFDVSRALNGVGGYNFVDDCDEINTAISYLDRRGLIERQEDAPHLVRFVEP